MKVGKSERQRVLTSKKGPSPSFFIFQGVSSPLIFSMGALHRNFLRASMLMFLSLVQPLGCNRCIFQRLNLLITEWQIRGQIESVDNGPTPPHQEQIYQRFCANPTSTTGPSRLGDPAWWLRQWMTLLI